MQTRSYHVRMITPTGATAWLGRRLREGRYVICWDTFSAAMVVERRGRDTCAVPHTGQICLGRNWTQKGQNFNMQHVSTASLWRRCEATLIGSRSDWRTVDL